jgi:hypothetical protein
MWSLLLAVNLVAASVTVFVDETEFNLACRAAEQLIMGPSTVRATSHNDRARVGSSVACVPDSTTPLTITLQTENKLDNILYHRIDEASGALEPFGRFFIEFDTTAYHRSVDFALVYAAGLSLQGPSNIKGKVVDVLSPTVSGIVPSCKCYTPCSEMRLCSSAS